LSTIGAVEKNEMGEVGASVQPMRRHDAGDGVRTGMGRPACRVQGRHEGREDGNTMDRMRRAKAPAAEAGAAGDNVSQGLL